jgi:hypothetical protein
MYEEGKRMRATGRRKGLEGVWSRGVYASPGCAEVTIHYLFVYVSFPGTTNHSE